MHVNEIPGYSFPIYFVVKRVTHKVLCVRPHHQSGWPPMSALLAAPAKPTGRKRRVENVIFRPRHEGEILLVWLVNKVEDKKEQQNRKSFHFACLKTVNGESKCSSLRRNFKLTVELSLKLTPNGAKIHFKRCKYERGDRN